ncbi:MAG: 50S ribosomal protein L9 [Lachnospiraceae bacterium]|nr:50S ribosomal protein L9 [Lachnospiraceae bacterium]
MKIILLQDVKSIGKKGEVIEANDGYARNYILPKKLGVEATGKNMNDLKLQKANEEKLAQEQLEDAQKLAELIATKKVVVKIKGGENGKAFGSVSSKEIVVEAKKQCDLDLDKKKVQLPEALKNFGSYDVTVKLHPKVTATLKVQVIEA